MEWYLTNGGLSLVAASGALDSTSCISSLAGRSNCSTHRWLSYGVLRATDQSHWGIYVDDDDLQLQLQPFAPTHAQQLQGWLQTPPPHHTHRYRHRHGPKQGGKLLLLLSAQAAAVKSTCKDTAAAATKTHRPLKYVLLPCRLKPHC